ncbi:MAG: Exopolyphosphatase [Flavobacteriales bacterium]|nr:Exopolyphosphatase [Flavobacteriales bacterium]
MAPDRVGGARAGLRSTNGGHGPGARDTHLTASRSMRTAIIDLGTNTFNLLVAERNAAGHLHVVHSAELPVFLGRGGIEAGTVPPEAFQRGMEALALHTAQAMALGAARITGFGTSALRSARNAGDFVRAAEARFDLRIRVLTGDEEAAMILDGVRQAVPLDDRPALVMDIGGGSMEFILATRHALMWKRSFELGVTRLRARVPFSEPPTVAEELRLAAHLDDRLEPLWAVIDRHAPHRLIGSAGSFDSLAALAARARGNELPADALTCTFDDEVFAQLKDGLMRMDRRERSALPGLPAHRVDHFAHALVAIERVLTAGGIRELAWSRYALKEGAAWRALNDLPSVP